MENQAGVSCAEVQEPPGGGFCSGSMSEVLSKNKSPIPKIFERKKSVMMIHSRSVDCIMVLRNPLETLPNSFFVFLLFFFFFFKGCF